ncbi:MAG TPA: hydrogenase maturation protease [Vicinamibacteria bacterium]
MIGIGNADRGDDHAGLEVARRVRARAPENTVVRECSGEAWCLLEAFEGRSRVILVDAACGGGRPGTTRRFEAHDKALPGSLLHTSTHSWGIVEAVEMARCLGRLPSCVVVYAIEGASFEPGRQLSGSVARAVDRVLKQILRELRPAPAVLRASPAERYVSFTRPRGLSE